MQGYGNQEKTARCLCDTCVSKFFNRGVEEKWISERTEHRSYVLFVHVSASLRAETKTEKKKDEKWKCNRYEGKSSKVFSFLNASSFTNGTVNIVVNENKWTVSVAG